MIKVGATIGKPSERNIVVGGCCEKQITVVSVPTTKGRRVLAPTGGRDVYKDQSGLDRDDFQEKGGIQIGPGRKVLRPNKEKGEESLVSLPQPSASVGINVRKCP